MLQSETMESKTMESKTKSLENEMKSPEKGRNRRSGQNSQRSVVVAGNSKPRSGQLRRFGQRNCFTFVKKNQIILFPLTKLKLNCF